MKRGRRGEGTVFLRGTQYYVGYYTGPPGNRKKVNQRTPFVEGEKGKAQAMLRDILHRQDKGIPVPVQAHQITVRELLDSLLKYYSGTNTRNTFEASRRADRVVELLGDYRAVNIGQDVILWYIEKRRERGRTDATIERELALLRKGFRVAVQAGTLAHVPHIPGLGKKGKGVPRKGFLTEDDIQFLLPRLEEPFRAVVELAYLSGWRVPSEVLTLTWDRVDLEKRVMWVEAEQAKTDEPRNFHFDQHPDVERILRDRMAKRHLGSDAVFHIDGEKLWHYRYDGGVDARQIQRAWGKAVKGTRLEGRVVHDLRRSAIRNLIEIYGVSESTAMEISGHKTRRVLDDYHIKSEEDLRNASGRAFAGRQAEIAKVQLRTPRGVEAAIPLNPEGKGRAS